MRTLILMPGWNVILFWRDAEGHGAVDESTLPISDTLKHDLRSFYAWFSELFFADHSGERASFLDRRLLDARGAELWRRLRNELDGTYRVLFYSEEFNHEFERPDDFTAMLEQT
jgi:hypothetical protein